MIEKLRHRAVLAIWTDYAGTDPGALMSWYRKEHLIERTSVPGFLTGNKYAEVTLPSSSADTAPHFAFYEATTMRPLAGGLYHERLNNPTPLTREIMPGFRRSMRTAMHVAADSGVGRGAHAVTLRFQPAPQKAAALEGWLHRDLLPSLLAMDGIVRCQFWQGDPTATVVNSAERKMRGTDDALAKWALLIEATDRDVLASASAGHAKETSFVDAGADSDAGIVTNHYMLQFALANPASVRNI